MALLAEKSRVSVYTMRQPRLHRLAWWQLWNFIECQAKFNRFLYPNKHIQRIFWYLVRLFESELSKIGNFQSSESFLEAKFHLIILKMIFSSEYQSKRTPFFKYICNSKHFRNGIHLVKMCPNFDGSDSKCLISNQKSFEYAHWDMQIYLISLNTPRNSAAIITLMFIYLI